MNDGRERRHGLLAGKLLLLAAAMFGFGFLLVPLYDVFCEVAGIGTRTGTPTADAVSETTPDQDRLVTVEFVASLNQYAPWEFHPAVTSMQVHPGEFYETTYYARNLTQRHLTAQAVPSIAPGQASEYFKKVECFCFTQQEFEAGEGRDMGLKFMVDPELPEHIDRITLSYTFFARQAVAQAGG
ncbi:MAG: cytochrome c oxidase assembly protein [Gammaproteobacteria bacterium]|nr:MAG: cytochrome c oxidase assembly protein [Gammaproteobacteria bacterium]